MINVRSPYMAGMMDNHITGGTDPYGDDESERCCNCGRIIREGDEYYDVNGELYCMNCEEHAEDAILAVERVSYIFEM